VAFFVCICHWKVRPHAEVGVKPSYRISLTALCGEAVPIKPLQEELFTRSKFDMIYWHLDKQLVSVDNVCLPTARVECLVSWNSPLWHSMYRSRPLKSCAGTLLYVSCKVLILSAVQCELCTSQGIARLQCSAWRGKNSVQIENVERRLRNVVLV